MATLVLEDGTGKTDSNAYTDEAAADAYMDVALGNPSSWTGATTATKEAAIMVATSYLDKVYGDQWVGVRANEDQALDWPRQWARDIDDYIIESTDMPKALADACAEAALRHITEANGLLPDIAEPGTISEESVAVGPIRVSTTYAGGRSQTKKFVAVGRILASAGLIIPGTRLVR